MAVRPFVAPVSGIQSTLTADQVTVAGFTMLPITPSPSCVVVADANRDTADTLSRFFRLQGVASHAVYDADAVIETAFTLRPRAIILSIALPKMDEYRLALYLRRFASLRTTYLIAHTGFARDEEIARALAAGFDRHFTKPANLTEVLATLLLVGVRRQATNFTSSPVAHGLPYDLSTEHLGPREIVRRPYA